jgi:hypothetical protein
MKTGIFKKWVEFAFAFAANQSVDPKVAKQNC